MNFNTRAACVQRKAEEGHTRRRRYTHGGIRPPMKLVGTQGAHLINVDIKVSVLRF